VLPLRLSWATNREDTGTVCAGRSLPARLVERAKIILLAAGGKQDLEIAAELGIANQKSARWRAGFLGMGIAGLEKDAPRPGRTPSIAAETVENVIAKTPLSKPTNATYWSTRTMAAEVGISEASVRRIWHGHGGLKPHRGGTFRGGQRGPYRYHIACSLFRPSKMIIKALLQIEVTPRRLRGNALQVSPFCHYSRVNTQ
jgi:hypothetical protein